MTDEGPLPPEDRTQYIRLSQMALDWYDESSAYHDVNRESFHRFVCKLLCHALEEK